MEPVARVEPAARKGKEKKQTERRQQRKHKKNVALHWIRMKIERIRHQEWNLHQGVNEATTKKSKKEKNNSR
jgi:hypothetical protein